VRRTFRSRRLFWVWGPISILLVVWLVLYLPHLRTCPGWYGDETIALTAAQDLMRGNVAHRAIWNTFWHPYAPYQPGYLYLVGLASALTGGDILGPRFLNTLIALATALLIAFHGRAILGVIPSLFAALLFLSYEQTVLHFRSIFTHNLIAFGFALTFLSLCRKSQLKSDLTAGVGLALGAAALPLFVYGAIPAGIWRLTKPKAWLALALPSCAVVAGSLAFGYFAHAPHNFLLGDLLETLDFYFSASVQNSGSLAGLATNLWRFFSQDAFHMLGAVAILCSWNRRVRAVGFGAAVIAILLLQNRQNLTVFYYQAVILLPLTTIAIGNLLNRVIAFMRRLPGARLRSRLICVAALLLPIFITALLAPLAFSGRLIPRNNYWVTQSTADVEAAAEWINQHVTPTDLVICHHNIAWLLNCRTADFLMATTWSGLPTWPFKRPLQKSHFRFAADPSAARFLVVGDIDVRWTFLQPNVDQLLENIAGQGWKIVWQSSTYCIFARSKELGVGPPP